VGSLRFRLLALTSLLLVVSFGVLIVVLDNAFRAALERAQRDMLDTQVMALLAMAEPAAGDTLAMPAELPELRLANPGSGLYARILDDSGSQIWQSVSALGIDFSPAPLQPESGQSVFRTLTNTAGETLQSLSLGVIWEFPGGGSRYYSFHVAESLASLKDQLNGYRGKLFIAFALIAVLLLLAVASLLGFLLRPLGRIEDEINAVELGEREALSGGYPTELEGVARNLNVLLSSERRRTARYRETLDNLAHSLKTPLAALRSLLGEGAPAERLAPQLARMEDIVRYQLSRPAAAQGRLIGARAFDVAPEAAGLLDGLDKVYRDKRVSAELVIGEGVRFHGDHGDFLELLGNLLDNAYKWCRRRVVVTAENLPADADQRHMGLRIVVADDGPGFPDGKAEAALDRGRRLDESTPGSGIGLAVVRDIAALYHGEVTITQSELGGAAITVTLPPA
jgi:two-component system sensor histidine kinase PhoQ